MILLKHWLKLNKSKMITVNIHIVLTELEMLKTCFLFISCLVALVLVGRSIKEDDGEDVQVPHAIDPSEKATVHL